MMKSSEINKAYENTENSYDKEHVTPFIKRNANIKECYTFEKIEPYKSLRLTIDYPSDYALMTMIYSLLKNKQKSVKNIFKLIDNNNWMVNINKDNFQKKIYLNIDEEIEDILPLIKERELNRLQNLLINL